MSAPINCASVGRCLKHVQLNTQSRAGFGIDFSSWVLLARETATTGVDVMFCTVTSQHRNERAGTGHHGNLRKFLYGKRPSRPLRGSFCTGTSNHGISVFPQGCMAIRMDGTMAPQTATITYSGRVFPKYIATLFNLQESMLVYFEDLRIATRLHVFRDVASLPAQYHALVRV